MNFFSIRTNDQKTIGKILNEGDDWHFDIQHISAQTRFLRKQIPNNNLVIIYLETSQKSWPLWKSKYKNYTGIIDSLVTYLTELFSDYNPDLTLYCLCSPLLKIYILEHQ